MFSGVGRTLKWIAKICFWVGTAVALIDNVLFVISGGKEQLGINLFVAFMTFMVWCAIVFICSLLLYGFGHLIVNSDLMLAIQRQTIEEDTDAYRDTLYKEYILYEWKMRGLITEKEYREKKREWGLK